MVQPARVVRSQSSSLAETVVTNWSSGSPTHQPARHHLTPIRISREHHVGPAFSDTIARRALRGARRLPAPRSRSMRGWGLLEWPRGVAAQHESGEPARGAVVFELDLVAVAAGRDDAVEVVLDVDGVAAAADRDVPCDSCGCATAARSI